MFVAESRSVWREIPEVGTIAGLRLVIAMCDLFGRRLTRVFVSLLAFYYGLLSRRARRSSRDYLRRMQLPHGFWQVSAHIRCFAHTVLDRAYFVRDRFEPFEINYDGHEHLVRLLDNGKGAVLLGAHIGSFEAMRAQSVALNVPITVIGDFSNAPRINAVLQRINPHVNTRLLQITPGSVEFALRIREVIERGELVAILGDRTGHGKTIEVDFLGARARFAAGPYLLAATLRCPIYLAVALHHAPNRYDLYCEPFAEEVRLPRENRQPALEAYAQRYARRLEHFCRLGPHNWFNFFPFWPEGHDASPPLPAERHTGRPETAVRTDTV